MSGRVGDWDLAFTGERVVPGKTPPFLVLEHLVRYRFAARSAAGCTVLDVGCGTGYGASLLAAKARLVVGVDNAPEAIEYAQANYPGGNLRFAVADCRNLPFPDGFFDLAVIFEVIEHIPEQTQCLGEIRRVLGQQGLLVLSTPNAARATKAIEEENPSHHKELSEYELLECLRPHFAHVRLLYQHEVSGSSIRAAGGETTGTAEVVEDFSVAAGAKYFLAVCSSMPLPAADERLLGVGGTDHQIAIVQDLRHAEKENQALLRQREENDGAYANNLAAHQRETEAKQEVIEALLRQREENERAYANNLTAHQREIEALLRQREENERAYANNLAAHQREIEALLRQREENEREYAKNLAAHAEIIHNEEQRIAALERRLQEEIAVRDRQLAELESQNTARRIELEWLYRWIPVNKLARRLLYGRNLRKRLITLLRRQP
jgi:SAM-dependent methyltransferase